MEEGFIYWRVETGGGERTSRVLTPQNLLPRNTRRRGIPLTVPYRGCGSPARKRHHYCSDQGMRITLSSLRFYPPLSPTPPTTHARSWQAPRAVLSWQDPLCVASLQQIRW